ncbi:hypothetical protein HDU78_004215 [Chytriomyces hyalinus]|nr:hypothetical protein HDU78_004215 [Chytriomyces hyalinus]
MKIGFVDKFFVLTKEMFGSVVAAAADTECAKSLRRNQIKRMRNKAQTLEHTDIDLSAMSLSAKPAAQSQKPQKQRRRKQDHVEDTFRKSVEASLNSISYAMSREVNDQGTPFYAEVAVAAEPIEPIHSASSLLNSDSEPFEVASSQSPQPESMTSIPMEQDNDDNVKEDTPNQKILISLHWEDDAYETSFYRENLLDVPIGPWKPDECGGLIDQVLGMGTGNGVCYEYVDPIAFVREIPSPALDRVELLRPVSGSKTRQYLTPSKDLIKRSSSAVKSLESFDEVAEAEDIVKSFPARENATPSLSLEQPSDVRTRNNADIGRTEDAFIEQQSKPVEPELFTFPTLDHPAPFPLSFETARPVESEHFLDIEGTSFILPKVLHTKVPARKPTPRATSANKCVPNTVKQEPSPRDIPSHPHSPISRSSLVERLPQLKLFSQSYLHHVTSDSHAVSIGKKPVSVTSCYFDGSSTSKETGSTSSKHCSINNTITIHRWQLDMKKKLGDEIKHEVSNSVRGSAGSVASIQPSLGAFGFSLKPVAQISTSSIGAVKKTRRDGVWGYGGKRRTG